MARQTTTLTVGLPLNQNLLQTSAFNGIDKYFGTDTDVTAATNAANAAASAASAAQTSATNAANAAASAASAASTAQTSATNAGNAAATAQTTADNSGIAASTAQGTANNAVARIAGDLDYFEGTGTFTGTPSNLIVTSITPITATGINYTSGYFNFSYLGKYLVVITQGGDCVNTRADWYQEVTIRLKETVGSVFVPFTFKSIPPSGTWNMENTNSNILDVQSGNQWKPVINMTAGGSTTNGTFRIKIKKVI